MLLIFCGSDVVKVRAKAFEKVGSFEKKGMSANTVTAEGYEGGMLQDLVGAQSLFGGHELIVIDSPKESEELFEELVEYRKPMSASENVFIVIEGSLTAPEKKKCATYGTLEEYVAEKEERFNTFQFADALARKDKKSFWILLQKARAAGIPGEEILGILHWQAKSLRLVLRAKTPAEAGVKPFVFSKAKSALGNFKEDEVEKVSKDILSIYHDGHLGKRDIDIALEKFALSL